MKNKVIWLGLSFLLVAVMLLASCATSTTSTSTSTSKPTSTTSTTTAMSTSTKTIATTPATAIATTTTTTGHWWDSLGIPQYGGEMVVRTNRDIVKFDPYFSEGLNTMGSPWMEKLHADDWTLDPAVFDYKINLRPYQYVTGSVVETWELTDSSTYVVHIRKGIHWQDLPPVNGREFTADDVVYHYQRQYGLDSGMAPSPFRSASNLKDLISATAADKYTVIFKWKTHNPEFIMETIQVGSPEQCLENREAVEKWGDVNDWHHAIGTGPFILNDFVAGSSAVLVKNPNYWGYDERYPKNKLPYINTLKFLIIPDDATALAGLRTGKIDVMEAISLQNAQSIRKTNPELLQISVPISTCLTIDPRNDMKPFNDIRVREAMQMAIDLQTIAKSYYGGTTDPYPSSLNSRFLKGWGFPYEEWSQDLKNEYAYNPTAAKKLLSDAGYSGGFKTDIVADSSGDIDLLQVVKSYFTNVGIDMDIRTMDSASWVSFVQNGHKHDQLAQRGTGSLGLTYEPLRQITRFQWGTPTDWLMVNDPIFDAFYPKAIAAVNIDDIKRIFRDANVYVTQQHFAISLLQPNLFSIYQPWLKGYNGQNNSVSNPSAGPLFIGFYASRFWIDQGLKSSMGH